MKRLFAPLLLVIALVSCGKEAWDGRVYHAGRASFRAGPIAGSWQKIELEGAMLAFHDAETGGTLEVYGRCGQDGDDVPLLALTNHLLIGFTEREVKSQKVVPLDGREAMHTLVDAKLDGVPMSLSIYVLKKDGCVYDLVYVSPPEKFAAGLASFDAFAAGFSTVGG